MKNILILCTGNSCRSQMAQGYLQHFLGDSHQVLSAGIETHGVNPMAIQIMKEDGIDISRHTSNHVDEYIDLPFEIVLTVCDNANEHCPVFPGNINRIHKNFKDPAKVQGSIEDILQAFREVRDEIKGFSLSLSKQINS